MIMIKWWFYLLFLKYGNLQLHINFILFVNLKVTMNFPYEFHLSSAHPIVSRNREVERCAKMPRMG